MLATSDFVSKVQQPSSSGIFQTSPVFPFGMQPIMVLPTMPFMWLCRTDCQPSGQGAFFKKETGESKLLVAKIFEFDFVSNIYIAQNRQGNVRLCPGCVIADYGIVSVDVNNGSNHRGHPF